MTLLDIFAIAALLILIGVGLWLFFSWDARLQTRHEEWRQVQLAKLLFQQNVPSWDRDWEATEPLIRQHYMVRAKEVLALANKTARAL